MTATAAKESIVTEDFRRAIVSHGRDDKGPFAILTCRHKVRRRRKTPDPTETHRWCTICANRSPYR